MDLEKQHTDRLKVIEKKMKLIGLYNAPSMIVIGLGLFSKFDHDPGALHPLLTNSNLVNGALALALPWALYNAYKLLKLSLELSKLNKR